MPADHRFLLASAPLIVAVAMLTACGEADPTESGAISAPQTDAATPKETARSVSASSLTAVAPPTAQPIETRQTLHTTPTKQPADHHMHDMSAVVTSDIAMQPPAPVPEDGAVTARASFATPSDLVSSPATTRAPGAARELVARPPLQAGADDCVLDFTDAGALQMVSVAYWFDRTMIPWYQECGGAGQALDLRWSKYGHFHIGYQDPDLKPCNDPNATPAIIDDDGQCELRDVATEPRTHATVHWHDEVLRLRADRPYDHSRLAFDLNRVRILSASGARVCYRPAETPPSSGPWIVAGTGTGTQAETAGGWMCWPHLGPGLWDLSGHAVGVSEVKFTGSALSPGTFSIDDMHVNVRG
jgi:hypothetical protein